MKQGILFTIKSWLGKEKYYMDIDTSVKSSVENQILDTMENIGYCDSFTIESIEKVKPAYIQDRNTLINLLEKLDPTWKSENSVIAAIGTIKELEKELMYLLEYEKFTVK